MDVAKQTHYTKDKIQVIEFCEVNQVKWCAANVIKYIMRYEAKNGLEDLLKAETYLKTLIQYKKTGIFITPDKLESKQK